MNVTAAVARGRRLAESLMPESVTVSRVTGQSVDGNGRTAPTWSVVYRGRAALGAATVSAAESAGATLIAQQQVVKLPVSDTFAPRDGDLVEFLTGSTPHLVGVKMRCAGLVPARSHSVQWRVLAERVE